MLTKTIVEQIGRLVKEGKLTHRKIAERVGVGRSTVDAIARGGRSLFGRMPDPESDDCNAIEPAVRCKKCGFLVHPPCLVCRTRAFCEQRKKLHRSGAPMIAARRRRRRRQRSDRGRPRRSRVV